MLTLKADNNLLTSAKLEEMPFLQMASFNNNKITSTEGVNHPMLEHLSMNSKLTLSSLYTHFNRIKKNALGKHCGKGEIAHFEQFHLFSQCFLCSLYLNDR